MASPWKYRTEVLGHSQYTIFPSVQLASLQYVICSKVVAIIVDIARSCVLNVDSIVDQPVIAIVITVRYIRTYIVLE